MHFPVLPDNVSSAASPGGQEGSAVFGSLLETDGQREYGGREKGRKNRKCLSVNILWWQPASCTSLICACRRNVKNAKQTKPKVTWQTVIHSCTNHTQAIVRQRGTIVCLVLVRAVVSNRVLIRILWTGLFTVKTTWNITVLLFFMWKGSGLLL